MAGSTSAPGASVASRLLAMIGAFDEQHRSLALTDLAHRAGVPVPTAHRSSDAISSDSANATN